MSEYDIHRKGVREQLPRRNEGKKSTNEPYWKQIDTNCHLGYRSKGAGQGGSWIARYKIGRKREYQKLGRDTPTFSCTEAKKEAEKWFKEKTRGIVTGTTVESACREYVENRRIKKGEKNAHDAEIRFKSLVYGTPFGSTKLAALNTTAIEKWQHNLVTPNRGKGAVNRTLTTLKAALNFAVRNRLVSADVAVEWESVEPFENADGKRGLFLDLTQRRALLTAATAMGNPKSSNPTALRDLIEAATVLGARPGELIAVKRQHFDARTGALTLSGKSGPRTIGLTSAALNLFERLAKSKLPGAWLLTRDDGKPWKHSGWDELVRDAAAKAKLPKGVCLYTLRHSFITQTLQDGLPVSDVAKFVGTSAEMIEKTYHHVSDAFMRARLSAVVMV